MIASPALNNQSCESLCHVTIPMRRILNPATSQTIPAIKNRVRLLTRKLIFSFSYILPATKIVQAERRNEACFDYAEAQPTFVL